MTTKFVVVYQTVRGYRKHVKVSAKDSATAQRVVIKKATDMMYVLGVHVESLGGYKLRND